MAKDIDTTVVDTTKTETEVTVDEVTEKKTYDSDAFKEVIRQRDAAKSKLRAIQEDAQKQIKLKEEETLKASGNYDALISKVNAERAEEKRLFEAMIINNHVTSVATELGIAKPEYLKLIDVQVELDGLQVKNAPEVKKSLELFKKDNPQLFTPTKPIPSTDGVYKRPENDAPRNNGQDMIQAVAERMAKWKK